MKIHIKYFILTVFALIVCKSYGQNKKTESSSLNSTNVIVPYICDNGDFEITSSVLSYYSFYTGVMNNMDLDCDIDTSGLLPVTSIGLNSFTDKVTFVNNDISIFGGNDSKLASLTTPVFIPRINNGTTAIKLNNNNAGKDITRMTKTFVKNSAYVSYAFSLIMQYFPHPEDLSHFTVKLYKSDGTVLDDKICIIATLANPIFNIATGTGSSGGTFLYTGWKCQQLSTEGALDGEELTLEFVITDCVSGADYGTVYIDDICNGTNPCSNCDYCLELYDPAVVGPDYKQAEHCINAKNTINAGATASYHAGYEVVLKKDFTASYGSKDRFYIEGCSDDFDSRIGMSPGDNIESNEFGNSNAIQIYPNPTSGELNIITGDIIINSINLMTLDGKTIQVNKQSDKSNGSFRLDMNSVSQGVYLLIIENKNGEITTQKIVKN